MVHFFYCICAISFSVIIRWEFIRASSLGKVDHYYWILAARAFRSQKGFPVKLGNKYLLENDQQAYPPGFGMLLGALPESFLTSSYSVILVIALDILTVALLVVACLLQGFGFSAISGVLMVFGLAPVLVAYNTQLSSRVLGNFLLTLSLISQFFASSNFGVNAFLFSFVGVCSLAGVFMTHKMTTQFFIVLWPFWSYALMHHGSMGLLIGLLSPFLAIILATSITGLQFQRLQWAAHWDILTFWSRNWPYLGAHQFTNSPLYGDSQKQTQGRFHINGIVGIGRHISLVAAYLPLGLVLPLTLPYASSPPTFILTWISAAYLLALTTLLIPSMRCFGGGHLYVFNGVAPAALWWGNILSENESNTEIIIIFIIGLIFTLLSIIFGHKNRSKNSNMQDENAQDIIEFISKKPPSRVATFPMAFAERVALETHHAVFWGGHGLGFRTLEPYWPIMRMAVGETLRDWNISYVIVDITWWPQAEQVLKNELANITLTRFGRYSLLEVNL